MGDASSPGNTLGMGDPAIPCDDHPGSEPVCPSCKKKKKKSVKESILDDSWVDGIEENSIKDLLKGIAGDKVDCEIDPKTKLISSRYINGIVDKKWPNWLRFDNVSTLKMDVDDGEKNLEVYLPNKSVKVSLNIYGSENVILNGDLNCEEMRIYGDMKSIEFVGRCKIKKLIIADCRQLISLKGLEKSQLDTVNLPRELVGCMVRDNLKMPKTMFAMCGNTLHE